jgi:hypothetical protein
MGSNETYGVQALVLGTPAGRVAFDATFSEFVRVIKSQHSFTYSTGRIREEILQHLDLRDRAQAFLTVFDRWRACLSKFRGFGVPDKDVARMFNCPPMGALIAPVWPYSFRCKKMICPWCNYLKVLQLAQDPWLPLEKEARLYYRTYDVVRFSDVADMRKEANRDRHVFLRKLHGVPFIRFQRMGLALMDGHSVYRITQMLVFKDAVKNAVDGWEERVGTYGGILSMAFKYSAANLLVDTNWDLLSLLTSVSRFRRVETSR